MPFPRWFWRFKGAGSHLGFLRPWEGYVAQVPPTSEQSLSLLAFIALALPVLHPNVLGTKRGEERKKLTSNSLLSHSGFHFGRSHTGFYDLQKQQCPSMERGANRDSSPSPQCTQIHNVYLQDSDELPWLLHCCWDSDQQRRVPCSLIELSSSMIASIRSQELGIKRYLTIIHSSSHMVRSFHTWKWYHLQYWDHDSCSIGLFWWGLYQWGWYWW